MAVADGKNWFDFGLFMENVFIQVYLLFYQDAEKRLEKYRTRVVEVLKKNKGPYGQPEIPQRYPA